MMNEHVTLAITALMHFKGKVMHETAEGYRAMTGLGLSEAASQCFAMNEAQAVKFDAAIAYLRGLES